MRWNYEPKVYPTHTWQKESWEERVKDFLQTEDTPERFNHPFPMGVFGTLREGIGNNRLMHKANIQKHRKAFLPHFAASGLSVYHRTNSSAPFEVFYYEPEEWAKMIYSVDCLESFHPESCHGETNGGYYFRTLAWLRLLPEGYTDRWFPHGSPNLSEDRNMKIDPATWDTYEKVPCWVYSNMRATIPASQEKDTSIIYPISEKWKIRCLNEE